MGKVQLNRRNVVAVRGQNYSRHSLLPQKVGNQCAFMIGGAIHGQNGVVSPVPVLLLQFRRKLPQEEPEGLGISVRMAD